MARLVYSGLTSLDGYVADADGRFDWAMPDAEVHAFVNDLQRSIGTHLYGRRLYEVMRAWEDMDLDGEPAEMQDFAEGWRGGDKVVYSRTLTEVTTARTRLARVFDPGAARRLVAEAERDVLVGGPTLAAHALRAGLVDEIHQLLSPVVVGGGTRFLPDDLTLDLRLRDSRTFGNGVVHLAYDVSHDVTAPR